VPPPGFRVVRIDRARYGADPRLSARVRSHRLSYVLAVPANRRIPTDAGPIRVDALPTLIPTNAWQKHSAGAGAHGPRVYFCAWFQLSPQSDTDTGVHHLLSRRNDTTGELAYLRCCAGQSEIRGLGGWWGSASLPRSAGGPQDALPAVNRASPRRLGAPPSPTSHPEPFCPRSVPKVRSG